MITRAEIKESIKDSEQRLKYPCNVNVEQLSSMKPDTDWYIEQLISNAGNGDSYYELTTYDTNINRIVMMRDLSYSYKIENEEELIDLIEGFEEIYEVYMNKSNEMFLAYKKYKDENSEGKN